MSLHLISTAAARTRVQRAAPPIPPAPEGKFAPAAPADCSMAPAMSCGGGPSLHLASSCRVSLPLPVTTPEAVGHLSADDVAQHLFSNR